MSARAPSMAFVFRSRLDCLGAGVALRTACGSWGLSPREASEVELLLVELATNTVRHASRGRAELHVSGRTLTLTVDDDGPGYPAWVLGRFARRESVEAGFKPEGAGVAASGLGAGLDAARRLARTLELGNRDGGGARAVATYAWRGR